MGVDQRSTSVDQFGDEHEAAELDYGRFVWRG